MDADCSIDVRVGAREHGGHCASGRQSGDIQAMPVESMDFRQVVGQCGAPLANPDPLAMQSISCTACRAVNQVAPTAVLTAWATVVSATHPRRMARRRAANRIDQAAAAAASELAES